MANKTTRGVGSVCEGCGAKAEYGIPIGGGFMLACGPCVDKAEDVSREDCEPIRGSCPCGEILDDFGACAKCDSPERRRLELPTEEEDQPEPPPVVHRTSTCEFCGTEFEGSYDETDCGGCRLNDADLAVYASRKAAVR